MGFLRCCVSKNSGVTKAAVSSNDMTVRPSMRVSLYSPHVISSQYQVFSEVWAAAFLHTLCILFDMWRISPVASWAIPQSVKTVNLTVNVSVQILCQSTETVQGKYVLSDIIIRHREVIIVSGFFAFLTHIHFYYLLSIMTVLSLFSPASALWIPHIQ